MAVSAEAKQIARVLSVLAREKPNLNHPDAWEAIDRVLEGRKGLSTSKRLEATRTNRHKVIQDRNRVILWAINASGAKAHRVPTANPESGSWTQVLCIHTDEGQLHWKLSTDDQEDFADLPYEKPPSTHYDGCKAPEKAERLAKLARVSK